MRRTMIGWGLLFFTVAIAHAQEGPPVDPPEFKPGDSWTYQRESKYDRKRTGKFKMTVTAVTETGYTMSKTVLEGDMNAGDTAYTRQLNPVYDNGRKKTPFVPHFNFPMTPGKAWQGTWTYKKLKTHKQNKEFKATMKSRVEGWETIQTPAGEFRALKISFTATHRNQKGRGKDTEGVRWYSPEVGQVVRVVLKDKGGAAREEVKELIAYQPAP